jgi:hypothetical protein
VSSRDGQTPGRGGAGATDLRVHAFAFAASSAFFDGFLVAKAPLWLAFGTSVLLFPIFYFLGMRVLPPWRDTSHSPLLGAAIIFGCAVTVLVVAIAVHVA